MKILSWQKTSMPMDEIHTVSEHSSKLYVPFNLAPPIFEVWMAKIPEMRTGGKLAQFKSYFGTKPVPEAPSRSPSEVVRSSVSVIEIAKRCIT